MESFQAAIALPEETLEAAVGEILMCLGEDPGREGLRATPRRVAESLVYLTGGYSVRPRQILEKALFADSGDELVSVRAIPFFSLCEHHLLPFFGVCHAGYLPSGRVVGLSKIARLVDAFARRLQLQERLTREIAEALWDALAPRGVGVVIQARHLCMEMRGAEKAGAETVTSCLLGAMRDDSTLRSEFFELATDGGQRRRPK